MQIVQLPTLPPLGIAIMQAAEAMAKALEPDTEQSCFRCGEAPRYVTSTGITMSYCRECQTVIKRDARARARAKRKGDKK